MYRILFVCLGNICRSPMAEFIFRDLLAKKGYTGLCEAASAATSAEELGNPVYPPAAAELRKMGISCRDKRALLLQRSDGEKYQLLIGMEERNLRQMRLMLDPKNHDKIHKLLSFAGENADISDPWYTGEFLRTRMDIIRGCEALIRTLEKEGILNEYEK